jgi:hypothetical protein
MHDLLIQERACPRCGIRRTVRLGFSQISVCFNCRWQWGEPSSLPGLQVAGSIVDTISPAEIKRLEIYRLAAGAGFYDERPVPEVHHVVLSKMIVTT